MQKPFHGIVAFGAGEELPFAPGPCCDSTAPSPTSCWPTPSPGPDPQPQIHTCDTISKLAEDDIDISEIFLVWYINRQYSTYSFLVDFWP